MAALYNCRVLDPACGSGAFPMGVLQQMVHILRQLDPTNEMWREFMIDLAIERSKTAFNTVDEDERRERLADIEEAFNRNINDPDYARKLYLIEHCIYGVDIQPIAVQISKLRFFISLVVDQKPTADAAHNFGIRPLPNLESKFVAANTLIPVEYDGTLVENNLDVRIYKERLRDLNHKIFLAKRNVDKQRLKESIKATRQALANAIEDTGFVGHSEAEQLAGWDMFNQNASSSYFDVEWMFGIKEGFDIIIANPPYVNLANIKPDNYRNQLKSLFISATNKTDLYAFFIENAFKLLKASGYLCYIVPHTWKATDSFKALRQIIFNNHSLCQVVNLNMGIFDAIVKPMIVLIDNKHLRDYSIVVKNSLFEVVDSLPINEVLDNNNLAIDTDSTRAMKNIFKLVENAGGTPLENHIRFSRGVKTSNDTRFILPNKKDNDCKKVYRGRNLKAYQLNWAGEYLWYRPDLMREKVGCVPHSKSFFEVPEKLVTQRVNSSYQLLVAYDNAQQYFLDTVNVSNYSTWNKTTSLKYLCGLLNSKLLNFWYCNKYRMPTIGGYELHSIPIKVGSNQNIINDLVTRILEKRSGSDEDLTDEVKELISQVDIYVYHLYNLEYDDVRIVDPDTSITREEYDNYKAD